MAKKRMANKELANPGQKKQINPLIAIVGGLFIVLLTFAIIAVAFHPGPPISRDDGKYNTAAVGDTVSLNYIGRLDNGMVFDTNENRPPLEVVLGANQVIPGFEKALYGLKKGDTKTFRIPPEEAYPYNPEAVIAFNKTDVVDSLGEEPEIGQVIVLVNDYGEAQGMVVEITETDVIVDFNSPVAGQYLTFEITVLEVKKASSSSNYY
ncbi:MAG: peptidylprolyl isomerase [Methanimicrococcus sp.]|nr:peptidylprolyl isomerase [Methanimicrococcus sp.]